MVSSHGLPLPNSPFFQSLLASGGGAVVSKQHLELLQQLAPLLLNGNLSTSASPLALAPQPLAATNQAIVIHFENVLVPTKWMADRLGLTKTAQGLDAAQQQYQQTPDLQVALAAIEQAAIQLLQIAVSLGPVYLVSDATITYVEVFCSVFFPRLTALLRDATGAIQLLAAPSANLSLSGKAAWKMDALRTICCEKLYAGPLAAELLAHPQTGRFAIVSLNAHDMDAIAATRVQQSVAPHAVLKMCKVASTSFMAMELEGFHAQLGTLARFVLEATAQDAPINHAL